MMKTYMLKVEFDNEKECIKCPFLIHWRHQTVMCFLVGKGRKGIPETFEHCPLIKQEDKPNE